MPSVRVREVRVTFPHNTFRAASAPSSPAGAPYDRAVRAAVVDVRLGWPALGLPGICARTGLPTRDGVILTPSGAGYAGAEVIVPFSPAAQLRRRALRRLAALGFVVTVLCTVFTFAAWFLLLPALVAAAVTGYAGKSAVAAGVRARVEGRELVIPAAHPVFADAVLAMSERCGGGGCDSCVSGCLPQVATV